MPVPAHVPETRPAKDFSASRREDERSGPCGLISFSDCAAGDCVLPSRYCGPVHFVEENGSFHFWISELALAQVPSLPWPRSREQTASRQL